MDVCCDDRARMRDGLGHVSNERKKNRHKKKCNKLIDCLTITSSINRTDG